LLETTGRKTGQRRRTPVGNGLVAGSDTFWLISEHGIRAGYVRNIQADPRARVKIGRRWRTGTAHILRGDNALERLRQTGRYKRAGRAFLGQTGRALTVRIDLDPS
jgi:deazaflavin-dependent oxidoreductase (nitroreductase family)